MLFNKVHVYESEVVKESCNLEQFWAKMCTKIARISAFSPHKDRIWNYIIFTRDGSMERFYINIFLANNFQMLA